MPENRFSFICISMMPPKEKPNKFINFREMLPIDRGVLSETEYLNLFRRSSLRKNSVIND